MQVTDAMKKRPAWCAKEKGGGGGGGKEVSLKVDEVFGASDDMEL